jgi:hypothetical protein
MSKNKSMGVFEFEIPYHATRREWAVYVIVAKHRTETDKMFFYVGKVGDNRVGCNPLISRIGNHFSHNKIHSQMRNKVKDTTEYNYKVFYSTFGVYNIENHPIDKDRVNQLERQLNRFVQEKLDNNELLLNPYIGRGISKKKEEERKTLLNNQEVLQIESLADKALQYYKKQIF